MDFWIEITWLEVRSKKCRINEVKVGTPAYLSLSDRNKSFYQSSLIILALNSNRRPSYFTSAFICFLLLGWRLSGSPTGVFSPSKEWMKKKKKLSPFEPSTTTWCNHRKRSNSHSRSPSLLPSSLSAFCRRLFQNADSNLRSFLHTS